MSWLSRAIDAGGENRYTLDEVEDGLFLTTGARRAKTSQFWELKGVQQEGSDIVISVVGPGDSPPVDALRTAVRGDVPARVDVLVVEESGRTTQL